MRGGEIERGEAGPSLRCSLPQRSLASFRKPAPRRRCFTSKRQSPRIKCAPDLGSPLSSLFTAGSAEETLQRDTEGEEQ